MSKYALYFAWVFSLLGILLSVYYGEVLGMEPCRLCWYQRCVLFPLAILLGIAAYRDDRKFSRYGLVLAGTGILLALLQVFIPASLCGNGCVEKTVVVWFITLPMLSAIGFAAIFFLLWKSLVDELP
jgi:disulfide bond formation protein DsbB